MKNKRRLALAMCLLMTGCSPDGALDISDEEHIVSSLRNGLKEHSSVIEITFYSDDDVSRSLADAADRLMRAAMYESEDPTGGDYIRYQYGGYSGEFGCRRVSCNYLCSIKLIPDYYSYLVYENKVNEKVAEIQAGFGFDDETADAEKVKAVYDYICQNVKYDRIHVKNPHHRLRSTAYSALCMGTATRQGYAVAVYRLLKENGIDARVVTGSTDRAEDSFHAWNICCVDGMYYNLDATWDSGSDSSEGYDYFLRGSCFEGHTPAEEFMTRDFTERYPVAESDYE